jgi:hypothetical protein
MKKHETLNTTIHVPSLPHAKFELLITREVTKKAGQKDNYSQWYTYVAMLERPSDRSYHAIKIGSGTLDTLPKDKEMSEEDIKLIINMIKNDLAVNLSDKDWNLT